MGNGCCGISVQRARSFLTKEERIGMLNEYKKLLDANEEKELIREQKNLHNSRK